MVWGLTPSPPELGKPSENRKEQARKDKVALNTDFLTIPMVSLHKDGVAFSDGDKYVFARTPKGKKLPPVDFIQTLSSFPAVGLLDIDGINGNSQQYGLIEKIREKSENELWVDAGMRTADDIYDLVVKGADRVILGTKTASHMDEFRNAIDTFENIIPSVDVGKGGKVCSMSEQMDGREVLETVDWLVDLGYTQIIVSDLGCDMSAFMARTFVPDLTRRKAGFFLNSQFKEKEAAPVGAMGFRGMFIGAREFFKGKVA